MTGGGLELLSRVVLPTLSGDDFADYCNVTALTQSRAVILLCCKEKIKLIRNVEVGMNKSFSFVTSFVLS